MTAQYLIPKDALSVSHHERHPQQLRQSAASNRERHSSDAKVNGMCLALKLAYAGIKVGNDSSVGKIAKDIVL